MNMMDNTNKETGPATTESGFALATKPFGYATANAYPQSASQYKRNSLSFITPHGRIVISARQERRALAALVEAGNKGVTALELSSWALRLAAYIHNLRTVYGLTIEMVREPHDEGWHGRYVLHTPCKVIESQMAGAAI